VGAKNIMNSKEWLYGAIAEVAFYATLYYVQMLLQVSTTLWVSSLILWVLINVSIMFCPVLGKYCK